MSYFKLQYKFELITNGEWIDEGSFGAQMNVDQAHAAMRKHIDEAPEMQCRLVKVVEVEEQVGIYQPVQAFEHRLDAV